MCFALFQHQAALALSCALLCLSITVAALPEHHAALIPMCLALSQYCMLSHVLCFVSASLTPFLLSLMCLSCLVTALALSCALLCLNITSLLCCLRVTRCSCSLMCLALSGSASRCSLKCFISARRSCALPCLSMTLRRSKPVNRLRSGSTGFEAGQRIQFQSRSDLNWLAVLTESVYKLELHVATVIGTTLC